MGAPVSVSLPLDEISLEEEFDLETDPEATDRPIEVAKKRKGKASIPPAPARIGRLVHPPSPLAAFLVDPSLLPKRPPTRR